MRLHFYVSKRLSQRVERVGTMLGHAKARAAAFLLDNASQAEEQAIEYLGREAPVRAAADGDNQPRRDDEADDVVLMYFRLEPEVAARISQLAKKQGLSISRVCARLLIRAVEDEHWIVDTVQARLTQALAAPPPGAGPARVASPSRTSVGRAKRR